MKMVIDTHPQTFTLIETKGDVWLRHDESTKLLSGGEILSVGDAIITSPMAEAVIESVSGKKIHIGKEGGDLLVIDSSVLDWMHESDEVMINKPSLDNIISISHQHTLMHEMNLIGLLNEGDFNFLKVHNDSSLEYQSIHERDTHSFSTIEVRDVISDFNPFNDRFIFPHPGSIAKGLNTFAEAQNKISLSHYEIALHKIDDHGYVSFKDSQGRDISLTDPAMLNPVVHYLAQNFKGNIGDTVMFKIAADSYIYHFHPELYQEQYSVIKFEGLAFDGLIASNEIGHSNYLSIDFS